MENDPQSSPDEQERRIEEALDQPGFATSRTLGVTVAEGTQEFCSVGYSGAIERGEVDVHACALECVGVIRMHAHSRAGSVFLARLADPGTTKAQDTNEEEHAEHGIIFPSIRTSVERIPLDQLPDELAESIRKMGVLTEEELAEGLPIMGMESDYVGALSYWPAILDMAMAVGVLIWYGHRCDESG